MSRLHPVATRVNARSYRVTCVPFWVPSAWHWAIGVEDRGDGRWAIVNTGTVYSRKGRWDVEPSPSNRPPGWLGEHRFTLPEALKLAGRLATTMTVNGYTPQAAIDHATAHGHGPKSKRGRW